MRDPRGWREGRWVVAVSLIAGLGLAAAPSGASAQNPARELGFAVVGLSTDFESLRLATGNQDGSVSLRLGLSPVVFVEPELGLVLLTEGGATVAIVNPSIHLGTYLEAPDGPTWFYSGHLAAQWVRLDGQGGGDVAVGATLGHRSPFLDGRASLRLEGRVRHWFDASTQTLSVVVKVGLLL